MRVETDTYICICASFCSQSSSLIFLENQFSLLTYIGMYKEGMYNIIENRSLNIYKKMVVLISLHCIYNDDSEISLCIRYFRKSQHICDSFYISSQVFIFGFQDSFFTFTCKINATYVM